MEQKRINHPHLTAIHRDSMSAPSRYLLENNLLKGRILDFGCGYGFDTDFLKHKGFDITGYDSYYRPESPEGKYDTIICNYVLNVLEPYEQADVLMDVSNFLSPGGCAYFTVRRDLKEEGFRIHYIHKEYTYQCNVRLPYLSLERNASFEIYQYKHFNQQQHNQTNDCVFCNLNSQAELICETATCVAFYDGYPVSPGHALIIPKRHIASYFDLTKHEREAMNIMLLYVKKKIQERFHPDGYNIGINVNEAAGQSIFHVHMHLIPRYKGDVKNPKGGVRGVIPTLQDYGEGTPYYEENLSSRKDSSESSNDKYNQKTYTVEQKREENGNAYLPWDDKADSLLIRMFEEEGKSIKLLSDIFERAPGAIRSRLKKLGKI